MKIKLWLRSTMLAACASAAIAAPAMAQKSQDTLRITWRQAVPDIDPYYNSLRTGMIFSFLVFDGLVYRDPVTMKIEPDLASSWTQIDPTTIDFTLRQNVTFQNGDPFTADDVVYTLNDIIHDKKVAVPSYFRFIASVQKIDAYHVRLKMTGPSPAALQYLAMVTPIWPKAYREKIGADAFAQAPIGTGPYEVTKVDGVTEIDLKRYDHYFVGGPRGPAAIKYIKIHEVPDETTEMTELLGGQADWIWGYNSDEYANVARMPMLSAMRYPTMRVYYMTIDAAGRTGANNPLTNVKVRQAIMYAIDRPTMAKQLMPGGSTVIDTPCYPAQFGCDVSAAVKYTYDPVKAKQLLVEAGYPNGFSTTLVTYLQPEINAALQNYLGAVGIKANIQQLQNGAAVQAANDNRSPLWAGSWGSNGVSDISAFMPFLLGGGSADYAQDATVQKLLQQAGVSSDPKQRQALYSQAIRIVTEKAEFIPLFNDMRTVGYSKDLNFTGYSDDLPRFYLASWK